MFKLPNGQLARTKREWTRWWRDNHPEVIAEERRRYHQMYMRKWRKSNAAKNRGYTAKYKAANLEVVRERDRLQKWVKRHPLKK